MIFIKNTDNRKSNDDFVKKALKMILYILETIVIAGLGYILYLFLQQFLMITLKLLYVKSKSGIKIDNICEIMAFILAMILIILLFITFSYKISKKWNEKYIIDEKAIPREKNNKKYHIKVAKTVINTYLTMMLGILLLNIISSMFYSTHGTNNQRALSKMFSNGGFQLWYVVILSLIIAPIIEEILIRFTNLGFLRHKLMNIWNSNNLQHSVFQRKLLNISLWLFSSICFSLLHSPNGIFSFLEYFWMGICFGYVYLRYDDVRASIAIHTLNNVVALLQMFLVIG